MIPALLPLIWLLACLVDGSVIVRDCHRHSPHDKRISTNSTVEHFSKRPEEFRNINPFKYCTLDYCLICFGHSRTKQGHPFRNSPLRPPLLFEKIRARRIRYFTESWKEVITNVLPVHCSIPPRNAGMPRCNTQGNKKKDVSVKDERNLMIRSGCCS